MKSGFVISPTAAPRPEGSSLAITLLKCVIKSWTCSNKSSWFLRPFHFTFIHRHANNLELPKNNDKLSL